MKLIKWDDLQTWGKAELEKNSTLQHWKFKWLCHKSFGKRNCKARVYRKVFCFLGYFVFIDAVAAAVTAAAAGFSIYDLNASLLFCHLRIRIRLRHSSSQKKIVWMLYMRLLLSVLSLSTFPLPYLVSFRFGHLAFSLFVPLNHIHVFICFSLASKQSWYFIRSTRSKTIGA